MSIVKQLLPSQARAKIAQIRAGDFAGWFGVRGTRDHSLKTKEWQELTKLASQKPAPTPDMLRARKRIEFLKGNPEYQASMRANEPRDRVMAQSEWRDLHQQAYPSTDVKVDKEQVSKVIAEIALDPQLNQAYNDRNSPANSLAKKYVREKLQDAVTVHPDHDDCDDEGVTVSVKTAAD